MQRGGLILSVLLIVAAACLAFIVGESHSVGVGFHDHVEHCTAIVLDNGGHGVFGANFDHSWTDEGLVFVNQRGVVKSSVSGEDVRDRTYWTTRYASVSFNLVGYEYAWGGMNEAGLSVSTMSLAETRQPPPDHRPPLDNGEWVQYILDTCATVEDVIATDADVRILTVDHYLVGDGFGNAATIEFLNGRMVVHSGTDLPVAALTNNTYDDLRVVWERLRAGRNYAGLASSFQRFCLAADRVDSFRPTTDSGTVGYVFDTLDMVRGERFSASPTNWSLVFDTKNLRAYFKTGRNRQLRWVDLKNLDLRCSGPVKMMDIHQGGPGDVVDVLIDFDRQLNRFHLERFLSIWGVGLTSQEITWILNHLEAFHCVTPHRRAARRVAP